MIKDKGPELPRPRRMSGAKDVDGKCRCLSHIFERGSVIVKTLFNIKVTWYFKVRRAFRTTSFLLLIVTSHA